MPPKNEMTPNRKYQIFAALALLSAENPDHWTDKGEPAMNALEKFADDPSISRKEVEEVAPGFERGEDISIFAVEKPEGFDDTPWGKAILAATQAQAGLKKPDYGPAVADGKPATEKEADNPTPPPSEKPPTSAEKFIADEIAPRREAVPEILELVVASLGGVEISHPARGTIVALAAKARDLGVAEALRAAK